MGGSVTGVDSASAGAPHQGSSNTGVTVVGIPARNEAATIGAVARTADAGLTRAFPDGINVIVLAENGSVDDTAEQFLAARGQARQLVVRSGAEGTGKGTNVFAITEQAMELGADRVVLLDADVRSTEPEWIELLARAVDGDQPTLAVPMYRRNRFEANTTNHLASPLLAAVFGVHVQQPIGGEFAYSLVVLEETAQRYIALFSDVAGEDFSSDATVDTLRADQRQLVEIMKALATEADITPASAETQVRVARGPGAG